jgi:hypothetical protein
MPANFGALRERTESTYANKFYIGYNFLGTMDEVRVSSTAHSAERISQSAYGYDALRIARIYPEIAQRGVNAVPIRLTGYGFDDVTVTTNRADVSATIVSATISQLDLAITATEFAALGPVQLTLTDSRGNVVTTQLTIVDQKPFPNSNGSVTGSVVLWHLDETGDGAVRINGYGDNNPLLIGGTAGSSSLAQSGRFDGGRARANVTSDTANGALNFGANSLTAEAWIKTNPATSTNNLLWLYNTYYGDVLRVELESSGELRARVFDLNSASLTVSVPRTYNPQTGYWRARVDDGYWHYVAIVLDRTNQRFVLYVDGMESAFTTIPANFGALRERSESIYQNRLYASNNFLGTIDEVRMLNFARTAQQIQDTWFGTNTGGFGANKPAPSQTARAGTDNASPARDLFPSQNESKTVYSPGGRQDGSSPPNWSSSPPDSFKRGRYNFNRAVKAGGNNK